MFLNGFKLNRVADSDVDFTMTYHLTRRSQLTIQNSAAVRGQCGLALSNLARSFSPQHDL